MYYFGNKFLLILLVLQFATACSHDRVQRDEEGLTPLHLAAGHGDVSALTALLNDGVDVNALDSKMGVSVLHKAVYSGNPEAVKLLLKNGALINIQSPSNGNTPLHDAIYFKKKAQGRELIEFILRSGASLAIRNRAGLTPLESAELLKDQETVALIKTESDHRFSLKGKSLMDAVRKNDAAAVSRLLKDSSIPIEEADEQGFTPLLWAAREGMTAITLLLIERGADPNHLDSWMGANAGHKAAFWGRTEVMKILVKHKLDLNSRGLYNGYTPLHDAISGNHYETTRVLVAAGARTDIRGHDGKTVGDIARENGNENIIKLLEVQLNSLRKKQE